MTDTTFHMPTSLDGAVAGPEQGLTDGLGIRGQQLHLWNMGDPRAKDADRIAGERPFDGNADFRFKPVEALHSPLATHIRYPALPTDAT